MVTFCHGSLQPVSGRVTVLEKRPLFMLPQRMNLICLPQTVCLFSLSHKKRIRQSWCVSGLVRTRSRKAGRGRQLMLTIWGLISVEWPGFFLANQSTHCSETYCEWRMSMRARCPAYCWPAEMNLEVSFSFKGNNDYLYSFRLISSLDTTMKLILHYLLACSPFMPTYILLDPGVYSLLTKDERI